MSTAKRPSAYRRHAPRRDPLCWAGADARLLLDRLRDVRRWAKHQWVARCPGHVDRGRTRSLAVAEGWDGLLVGCRHGCALDEVLVAIGLTAAELGLDRTARIDDACAGHPVPPTGTAFAHVALLTEPAEVPA